MSDYEDLKEGKDIGLFLWDQLSNLLDKEPLLVGIMLWSLGHALSKANVPGAWRIQHVGEGLVGVSVSEGDWLAVTGDVVGVTLIASGITGTPVSEVTTHISDAMIKTKNDLEATITGIPVLGPLIEPLSGSSIQKIVDSPR